MQFLEQPRKRISPKYLVCIALVAWPLLAIAADRSIPVSSKTIGEEWPFKTITSGTIECRESAVVFRAGADQYSLNGLAKSQFGYLFPYEAGIVKQVPEDPDYPESLINADTEVLRKLCDQ